MPRPKKNTPSADQLSIADMPGGGSTESFDPADKKTSAKRSARRATNVEPVASSAAAPKVKTTQYDLADFAEKPKTRKTPLRPIPVRLLSTESRRQILYVCPHCGASFEMYGSMAKECWKCERPMDWADLPMMASAAFRDEYEGILYDADGRKRLSEQQKAAAAKQRLEEYVQHCVEHRRQEEKAGV